MNQQDNKRAVVLFSGGQDSTTVLALAAHTHGAANVYALCIRYGQRHEIELEAAEKVAGILGVMHGEELTLAKNTLVSKSPILTSATELGQSDSDDPKFEGTAPTFVEGRNILFLTIAANRLKFFGATLIYIGVSAVSNNENPDHRVGFLTYMEQALRAGLGDDRILIVAPFSQCTKREVVEHALRLEELGQPMANALAHSHTCYAGTYPPCGECQACRYRAQGFQAVGQPDPLLRRAQVEGLIE